MRVHYIKVEGKQPSASSRVTIGGRPIVAGDQSWPRCALCKTYMVFFFQLDVDKDSDLPLKPGSHLLVFMCPIHNDMPSQLLEPGERNLPADYWNRDFGHYKIFLNKSPRNETRLDAELVLKPLSVKYISHEEDIDWDGEMERGTKGFKLGGVPFWENDAEAPICSCGAEMVFTCQVPPRYVFAKVPEAAVQSDPVDPDGYSLFMGRSTYIFACKDQCTPHSVYAVTQESREEAHRLQSA
jgi:hypothetical protein